jgi:hypothetical protein
MLLDEPTLHPTLLGVWQSFSKLDRSRQIGFNGPQPIAFSEIVAMWQIEGDRDLDEFISYIQTLDSEYLLHYREKQDKKVKTSGTS